ncbi:MAG: MFS transporter [Candidatus Poribacteria bacterium]|nr:MFS transporter [Candidatus Poribacteria bacterium]
MKKPLPSESAHEPQVPPYQPERTAMWAFYGGTFLYWAALYVYSPILSVYADSLGASFTTVGMVVGAYGFVQMLLRIPLGIWSDRLGRRLPFLYAGHLFNFVGCLGLALAPSAMFLVVFRGVLGISAATWVAFTVLYASYFPPDQTPKAMGIITAINGISLIVVNGLGGQIAQIWGMVATFYVGAGLAIIGLVATVPITENRVNRKPPTLRQIWPVITHPALLITASITALSQYAFWGTTFSFIPLYADSLGASKSTLGVIGMSSLVPYTLTALANHHFARWLGENRAVFAGMLVMAAMAVAVPRINHVPLLAISQGVSGFGRGIVSPLLMGLSIRSVSGEDRATAMGVFQAVYAIGMFSGPLTAGAVADAVGLSGAFIISGTVSVIAAVAALILLKR